MVIGGAGFVGSHLVERLLAEDHQVDVVDDLSTGSLANLAAARAAGGELTIHTLDVLAPELSSLVARRSPDVIYHLALRFDRRIDGAGAARTLQSTVITLDAARKTGSTKVVVAVPAAALYGRVAARDQPVKEGHEWTPVGLRGVLARAVVDVLGVYRVEHDVEHTVAVLGTVYGPRQRAGVVAAFLAAAAAGEVPTVHGDGRQTRDFVFVDDTVEALSRAATRGGGLVVNVATGTATSIRDLWVAIAGAEPPEASYVAGPDGEVGRLAVSPTRARIHLAWAPWTDLATGLAALRP
ncbi:MAG: NAD-dependent epimerase/dehydratase family protein [Ilumatobacteraceae bacterium]